MFGLRKACPSGLHSSGAGFWAASLFWKAGYSMYKSFWIALNAVISFLCYLSLGYGVCRLGATDIPFLNRLTKLIFSPL